jgi:hypothetical protein
MGREGSRKTLASGIYMAFRNFRKSARRADESKNGQPLRGAVTISNRA